MEIHNNTESIREERDECIICLDDIENEWKKLECEHSYHKQCIDKWIIVSAKCPLCMKHINNSEIEEIQHNHQNQIDETNNRLALKFVILICYVFGSIVLMLVLNSHYIF